MNINAILTFISCVAVFMQVNSINLHVMRNNMLRIYIFKYLDSVNYKPLSIARLLQLTKQSVDLKLIQWNAIYNQISDDDKYILEQIINLLI